MTPPTVCVMSCFNKVVLSTQQAESGTPYPTMLVMRRHWLAFFL